MFQIDILFSEFQKWLQNVKYEGSRYQKCYKVTPDQFRWKSTAQRHCQALFKALKNPCLSSTKVFHFSSTLKICDLERAKHRKIMKRKKCWKWVWRDQLCQRWSAFKWCSCILGEDSKLASVLLSYFVSFLMLSSVQIRSTRNLNTKSYSLRDPQKSFWILKMQTSNRKKIIFQDPHLHPLPRQHLQGLHGRFRQEKDSTIWMVYRWEKSMILTLLEVWIYLDIGKTWMTGTPTFSFNRVFTNH